MVSKEDVESKLRTVIDPHTGISLVDMGLIKSIEVDGDSVSIKMTLTTPACPMAQMLVEQVREAAASVEGVKKVDVELVF